MTCVPSTVCRSPSAAGDAWAGRRIGLRQDDGRARRAQVVQADRRADRVRRPGHTDRRRRAEAAAPPDADGVPGSVRIPEPSSQRGPIVGEALRVYEDISGRAQTAASTESAAQGWAARGRGVAVSARVLERSAAAHRDRPRARSDAGLHRHRRARTGPGRLHPGADHQPARLTAGRVRSHVPLHRARPRRRPCVSDRIASCTLGKIAEISSADELYSTPASVHDLAALGRSRSPTPEVERKRRHPAGRRPAEPRQPPPMPLPHALPVCSRTRCRDDEPLPPSSSGALVACHWVEQIRSGDPAQGDRARARRAGSTEGCGHAFPRRAKGQLGLKGRVSNRRYA